VDISISSRLSMSELLEKNLHDKNIVWCGSPFVCAIKLNKHCPKTVSPFFDIWSSNRI
jgi:hypothetical protein